ncbi:MAG: HAD family hydrolase [Candidatus Heimdallarchaeota archaeon]
MPMNSDNQLVKALHSKSIRGIIFDFDGTLLDISKPLRTSIEEVFERKKLAADVNTTIEEIGALMETIQALPLPKILLQSHELVKHISSFQSLTYLKKLEIAARIFTKYLTYAKEAPFFPGSIELLKKLKKSYDLFIVSHNQTRNLMDHLEREGIENLFKGVYGADVLPELKPSPEALIPVFENYKSYKVKDFIMIGDMPSDIEAGQEAGVWTVGVSTGVSKKETLANFHPSLVIESLEEFKKIIGKKSLSDSNTQEGLKIKS